uniref:Uncharacterized protein n=1 Tax=Podarcis muralis TaxID=64176 RepID=A0A670IY09_PODMU
RASRLLGIIESWKLEGTPDISYSNPQNYGGVYVGLPADAATKISTQSKTASQGTS